MKGFTRGNTVATIAAAVAAFIIVAAARVGVNVDADLTIEFDVLAANAQFFVVKYDAAVIEGVVVVSVVAAADNAGVVVDEAVAWLSINITQPFFTLYLS